MSLLQGNPRGKYIKNLPTQRSPQLLARLPGTEDKTPQTRERRLLNGNSVKKEANNTSFFGIQNEQHDVQMGYPASPMAGNNHYINDDTIPDEDLVDYGPYYHSEPITPSKMDQRSLIQTTPMKLEFNTKTVQTHSVKAEERSFAQALMQIDGHGDIFSLAQAYQNICYDGAENLRKQLEKEKHSTQQNVQRTKEQEHSLLLAERNTWALLRDLEKDRRQANEDIHDQLLTRYTLSDKVVLAGLIARDRGLRQNMIVLDWLEATVGDTEEFFRQEILWRQTLHSLRTKSKPGTKPMVSELDPDSMTREHKFLHPDDLEDESRLLRQLWHLIREGKVVEAQQLCRECGQHWRAASLSGGELFHDGELAPDNMFRSSLEGNPFRYVWKSTCFHISNDVHLTAYERAVYASFCANLDQILPVCRNWEDYLWAYYRVLVETKIDTEMRERVNPLVAEDSTPTIANYVKSEEDIFLTLRNNPNSEIKRGALEKYHIIQEKIILGKIDELFIELASWVNENTFLETSDRKKASCPPQVLRFAAHLALFFFENGLANESTDSKAAQSCIVIISSYIQYLIETKQVELIALYTSKLPSTLQVPIYANFLKDIRETTERERCLFLAEKMQLNVPEITKRVVEIIRSSTQEDMVHEVPSNRITPDDMKKIRAIEWLCFDPSQRAEALFQSNAVARAFIASRRLEAANKLFDEVLPQDSVAVVLERQSEDPVVANAIKEHLCLRAYLECLRQYDKWHSHHSTCPSAPAAPKSDRYAEEIHYTEKLRVYAEQYAAWKETEEALSKRAKDSIIKVVAYPRGWLIDDNLNQDNLEAEFANMPEADRARVKQLQALRRQCLPNLFFLLHRVLVEGNNYQESLFIADMVADDHHRLYSVFTSDELGKLLNLIKQSCVLILQEQSPDPLGYRSN